MRGPNSTIEENFRAIRRWEQAARHRRSTLEQAADTIADAAATPWGLLAHVVWFGVWILWNTDNLFGLPPFDPFPFPLLTTVVSLEAIVLSLFVLASQNHFSQQQDKRANLDLQIDLLTEREMTAVLVLLQDIAKHLGVKSDHASEPPHDLIEKTDIEELTGRMDRETGTR